MNEWKIPEEREREKELLPREVTVQCVFLRQERHIFFCISTSNIAYENAICRAPDLLHNKSCINADLSKQNPLTVSFPSQSCEFWSYDPLDGLCTLSSDCPYVDYGCAECVHGSVDCDVDAPPPLDGDESKRGERGQ